MTAERPQVTQPRKSPTTDDGSIVIGWLTKITLILAFLGLLAFDGIALVTAKFAAADHASTAAVAAAEHYKSRKDSNAACLQAAAVAAEQQDELGSCTVLAKGHVRLTLHREATTIWMHRISFLKEYTRLSAVGEAAQPIS